MYERYEKIKEIFNRKYHRSKNLFFYANVRETAEIYLEFFYIVKGKKYYLNFFFKSKI